MSSKQNRIQRYIRQYEDRLERKKRRKKGITPLKVVLSVFIVGVILYFGIQFYHAFNQPLKTVAALSTTVNDEISAVGYFVRNETVITEEYTGLLQYVATEGSKLAKSELFANVYQDSAAAENTAEIEQLTERIETLQAALAYSVNSGDDSSDGTQTETLSAEIQSLLLQVNSITDSRNYSQLTDVSDTLMHDIINRDFAFSSAADVESTIVSLESRRDRLNAGIGERERGLYTPRAGFFSASADGYETILTPAFLSNMTLDSYNAIDSSNPEVPEGAVGKIVHDFSWYFVTSLAPEDANRLTVGNWIYMQFDSTGDMMVRVKVSDVRRQGNNDALVIFESNMRLSELIALRRQAARIILHTYEGLKVPKDALRIDDEYNMGVYVITGMYAEFKKIEPLYETQEYYIVKTDPSTTESLLVYDEIIVSGRDMENKKVIV